MFTQEQLQLIENAAKKTKNQGPMAVFKYLWNGTRIEYSPENIFTMSQWNIINYCAEECTRQYSGEMSVYWMVNAWNTAQYNYTTNQKIDLYFIALLGTLVEPYKNAKGIRSRPGDRVGISDGFTWIEKAPPESVKRNLELLIEAYYEGLLGIEHSDFWHDKAIIPEDQFYYQYETIHPFMDGNGRTGKIIYNYLNGTLDDPIMPPNFWGGSNP